MDDWHVQFTYCCGGWGGGWGIGWPFCERDRKNPKMKLDQKCIISGKAYLFVTLASVQCI